MAISRRSLLGITAAGAASLTFGVPGLIRAQGTDITLKWWSAWPSGPNSVQQEKLISDFHAAGNGAQIELTTYPNYTELANAAFTALESGDGPHIVTMSDSWWFAFYLRQYLHDLSPFVETPEDYVQSLYTESSRNGGQWAIPFARSTPLMYYNVEAMDAAGLDASIFETWSGFREAAPELRANGNVDAALALGGAIDSLSWNLHGPLWAFGGAVSDDDFNILLETENSIAAGTFLQEFVNSGDAALTNDANQDFQAGVVGATLLSTGGMAGMREGTDIEWNVAPLPQELAYGIPTGGSGLGVMSSASEEELAAAAAFLNFATNTENAASWSMATGYMPVRTSALETEEYKAFLKENPENAVAISQLPNASAQDAAAVFIPNGYEPHGRAWEQILVNNVDPADAFAEATAKYEAEKGPVLEALEAIEG